MLLWCSDGGLKALSPNALPPERYTCIAIVHSIYLITTNIELGTYISNNILGGLGNRY